MTLDEEQLKKARTAAEKLAETDKAAMLARAEYHTVIRRMHLGGASLREIAGALGMSHQRVQQIVDEAGGSWWRPRKRDAVCTFCEKPPSEVAKLISGPNVFICDACIAQAEAALGGGSREAPLALAQGGRAGCSFCGGKRAADRPMVLGPTSNICRGCVNVCRQILEDERKAPPPTS
jgi:hypothetical protein